MAKKRSSTKKTKPKPDFHKQTVLVRWAMQHLGAIDLTDFKAKYQITADSPTGHDPKTGLHTIHEAIVGKQRGVDLASDMPATLGLDRLQAYEQNILEHTQAINTARQAHGLDPIAWQYHQYLALLFTELYLDQYFNDPVALRDQLNAVIAQHNQALPGVSKHPDFVPPFPTEPQPGATDEADQLADAQRQLARLAFWGATGSGKTLLLHAHIHQFRWYQTHVGAAKGMVWDQVLLITPNDNLSRQHQGELTAAGIESITLDEAGTNGLFAADAKAKVKVLSIHKLRDAQGQTTLATEAFEGRNLVLVDEGHRGAGQGSEGEWMRRRDQLANQGFCIEYSATFKEVVGKDEAMRVRYARSILFDYAYRSFYRDGYGKDFAILNLEEDKHQQRYLTAALLLFYQQMKVWLDGGDAIQAFQIDKPLWVFVGHTVSGGKASTKDDRESVSDVVQVLAFFHHFLREPKQARATIQSLLEEGFVDNRGRNLLANSLPHLDTSGDKQKLAFDLHAGILHDVFHATDPNASNTLAVQLLKDASGEIAVKVGGGAPFGVVNVGDASAVVALCEKQNIQRLEDDHHRASLFQGINQPTSTVNLLVGSRKFTEGWNSWRVSSIGLMNMGKSEGTQIIQMFGRGVRLRGYQTCLRRSSVLTAKPKPPANLRQVETLQVFGVKASYMNQFRDWIFSELPETQDRQVWDLPVVKTLPERKLKTLRLREQINGVTVKSGNAFRKLGPLVVLRPPSETAMEDDWLRKHPTKLNWLPKIVGLKAETKPGKTAGHITQTLAETEAHPEQSLKKIPRFFFDIDALLFGLERHKASRGLDRLHADRQSIMALLERDDWYSLQASASDMALDRYENRRHWQRMAQQLINMYAERFYRFVRGRWEMPYLEVVEVNESDENMVDSYTIESTEAAQTADEIERIGQWIDDLRQAIGENAVAPWSQSQGQGHWRTVPFPGHLYQPLLHVGKKMQIRVSPVPLDEHEAKFVTDLAAWCQNHKDQHNTEIYLLRNQSVTGLGFFQAGNFFPDFLLWVCSGDQQHLVFVDPKGLLHHDKADPKIRFAKDQIPKLQAIIQKQAKDLTLDAFILSNTAFASLGWSDDDGNRLPKETLASWNILFQKDDSVDYVEKLMQMLDVANADHQ